MKRRDFLIAAASMTGAGLAHANLSVRAPFFGSGELPRTRLTFSYVTATGSMKDKIARLFAERVEALSEGRVQIGCFPASQLYPDGEEFAALQSGEVDFIAPALSKIASQGVPEAQLLDVPYLVTDFEQAEKALNGVLGQIIRNRMGSVALYLGAWHNGPKVFSSARPIQSVEDLQRLRIQVTLNDVIESYLKTLGAKPIGLEYSKVRAAVRSGELDALENTPGNLAEVQSGWAQPYLVYSRHGFMSYPVLLSGKTAARLSPAVLGVIERAMTDIRPEAIRLARGGNEAALERLRALGMKVVRPGADFEGEIKSRMDLDGLIALCGGKENFDVIRREIA